MRANRLVTRRLVHIKLMLSICLALTFISESGLVQAASRGKINNPDFTQGEQIPKSAKHDWNLGATGARGWMYSEKLCTTKARQIAITSVAKGSPADGKLRQGDVILGVHDQRFTYDPRTEFGLALVQAESNTQKGKLPLTIWRQGKEKTITLQLKTFGDYSATAPYDCPKSKRILENGCEALARKMADPKYRSNAIPRSLNALALLASGNRKYLPIIKKEADWASQFSANSMKTWYYGYVSIFLSEYIIATGDQSVLPGLRRLALEAANGQSAVGSWGHTFANPDGRLRGYGMMNSPGVPLTIGLVLAQKAGVKDRQVATAIDRSSKLIRFYIGKGAVPYGDHHPWFQMHEDNGKCGMSAMLFNLLKEKEGTTYFSHMSVASHSAERDTGHTGNFFNMIWAMPGVSLSGPQATGSWMREFGAWYYDMSRQYDGTFIHQGPPAVSHDKYRGWDCTGAYLLAYAMPLKKIHLTGKTDSQAPRLTKEQAMAFIEDGRGWSNIDRDSYYNNLSEKELLTRLSSWSPVLRLRAATALSRKKSDIVPVLIAMLKSSHLESRIGACEALAKYRGRAAPAIDALKAQLKHEDLWLRVRATEALAAIGKPAMPTVPILLNRLTQKPSQLDPRGMEQRYLCFALFSRRGGMLSHSLEGVDRDALFKAVRAGLQNQDGRARGTFSSVYDNLTFKELQPLMPAIHEAIKTPAPSGIMFADGIRMSGLKLFSKHRVSEGIELLAFYAQHQPETDRSSFKTA